MKKKKSFSAGMNVGSSSILVTFVLLCLVTFAALSFVSARSDYNLALKTADRITSYYAADNNAEIYLANADSLLSKLAASNDEKTFFDKIEDTFADNEMYKVSKNGNDTFIDYESKVSDTQSLCVTLKVVYPKNANDDTFQITRWENVTTYVPSDDTTLNDNIGLLF